MKISQKMDFIIDCEKTDYNIKNDKTRNEYKDKDKDKTYNFIKNI